MKLIGLQAGHQNIQGNCITALRGGTGAPGEKDNNVRIRDKVGQILQAKGFQVQLDDANANCTSNTTGKDFDFYLALHCEADVHGKGGGFMTAPDPAFDDSNTESKRIVEAIKKEYFKHSGIEEHEEWISINMTQYYMWNSLSSNTPCGIIEMGVAQNNHDKVILSDTDRVANAIARGICSAFGVAFDDPTPPVNDNIYKGYDLTDKTKMKEGVDALIKIKAGDLIDKNSCPKVDTKYQRFAENVQKELNSLG